MLVGRCVGGGHQGDDQVQGDRPQDGEAVDEAEVYAAAEEERGAVEHAEEDGPCQVAVVHQVLVDSPEGVEDC